MRATVMRKGQLVVDTIPDPRPGSGEVVVRTLACGICGSDLHTLQHGEKVVAASRESGGPFDMDLARDVVMGHEFCAELVDYGAACARALPVGAHVCSMPLLPRPDRVELVGYSNQVPGGYGEYMVLSEMLLLEVPNGLSARHAALTEPLAVGVHAVEKARLAPEDVPLVIGCGPVGLAVIAALRLRGAAPIIAADFSPARRALAERLGADVVIDPRLRSPYESWTAAATLPGEVPPLLALLGGGLRPGVFFECVGIPGIIDQMMRGAPRGARIVVVGVCMEPDRVTPLVGVSKELNLQFVFGYEPQEFAGTLGAIAEGQIPIEPLITGTVGLADVAAAFEELRNPERHAKMLVEPHA